MKKFAYIFFLCVTPSIASSLHNLKTLKTNEELLGYDFCRSIDFLNTITPEHLNWTVATPIQGPTQAVRHAGAKAFLQGKLHHYTNEYGDPELVQIIKEKFARQGLDIHKGKIVIDTSLFHIILKCLSLFIWKKGDNILIPIPTFGQHLYLLAQNNIPFATVAGKRENSGKITPEDLDKALVETGAKIFIFTNPINPTGASYSRDELEQLAKVLKKHGMFIISDEIFSDLILNPYYKHTPLASIEGMEEFVLTLNGIGKSKGLAGLRLSYGLLPNWLSLHWKEPICGIASPIEKAAIAALKATKHNKIYQKQLNEIYRNRLAKIRKHVTILEKKLQSKKPSAVPYIEIYGNPVATNVCLLRFPGLLHSSYNGGTITSGNDLALYLLHHAGVALTPGEIFYIPDETISLRITLSAAQLNKGFERISNAIMSLTLSAYAR